MNLIKYVHNVLHILRIRLLNQHLANQVFIDYKIYVCPNYVTNIEGILQNNYLLRSV